ncbi:MAG: hypothetical protein JXQ73_16510 [Phycisphaerae bacterium]|nr:hypothetical protein [Phycisphaerae bacterium]
MRRRLFDISVLAVLCGVVLTAGCSAPAAQRKLAERDARINYWLSEAAQRERIGDDRVAAGVREMGHIWNEDAFKTRRDVREVQRLIVEETLRWQRRQPAFQAEIAKELAGKPQNIEPVAIRMFY